MAVLSRLETLSSTIFLSLSKIAALYPRNVRDLMTAKSWLLILFTIWTIRFVHKTMYNAYFHPLSSIPGNRFLSSTYFFAAIGVLSGRSHYFLPATHQRYGKVARVGPEMVSVADKDMIREILVTRDFPKSVIHEGFELNDQHNLFSSRNKDFHKNRRRLVSPAFGLQYLRTLEPLMQRCIQSLICKIDQLLLDPSSAKTSHQKTLPKNHINMFNLMNRLSLDIIGESGFGESFNMIQDGTHPMLTKMAKTLKRSMQQSMNPWIKWFIPLDYSFMEYGKERVDIRRGKGEKGRRSDLLQYMLDAQAKERQNGNGETGNDYEDMIQGKLTDRAVETECTVFLVAGSETSSTALTVTMMYLVKNPKTLAKLRAEIDFACANNQSTLPTYEQVRNLPYLTACLNESMRLRPVAATGLPREVPEDTVLGGYFFPKGTIVIAQTPQLHWSEEYFPKANSFIPERWIAEESPFGPIQDFTFYPFSAGTRNCVGKNFAMMEMRLILAALVKTYEMKQVSPQREDYVQFITTAYATESYVIEMKRRFEKQ